MLGSALICLLFGYNVVLSRLFFIHIYGMHVTEQNSMVCIKEHDFVDVSGQSLFYLEAGPQDGPLLIFIHGWPALAVTWTCQLETFANLGYRVVAPDMPGELMLLDGACASAFH